MVMGAHTLLEIMSLNDAIFLTFILFGRHNPLAIMLLYGKKHTTSAHVCKDTKFELQP